MHRLVRTVGVAGLLAALLPAPVAHAGENSFTIVGTGTITPGLPCESMCNVVLDFTAVFAGQHATATANCTMVASEFGSTITAAYGSGSVTCSGVPITGTLGYSRVLQMMTLQGTLIIDGVIGYVTAGLLGFVPLNAPQVTTFAVSGSGLWSADSPPPPPPPPPPCNIAYNASPSVCVSLIPRSDVQRFFVDQPQTGTSGSRHVVGAVDMYRMMLPTGGSATLPCVVLSVDSTETGGCDGLGWTFVSRVVNLVDTDVAQPSAGLGGPLASVGVCTGTLTATVAGFGVEDVPVNTLC
jgi:hypothetical protein